MSICLLLAAPRLAYGIQMLQPAAPSSGANAALSGEHLPLFMPQDQCVQSSREAQGCAAPASVEAGYVVGNVTYHGGPVMHSATNYAIFWLPPGYHFDTPTIDPGYSNASDASYEALVGRYFGDLSDTAFYSIIQQYTDSSGAPGLVAVFGGSWVDTSPYPNSEGSRANPLQDSDIQAEVTKAMSTNGWPAGNGNSEFFVFTGQDVYGCAGESCSYSNYCGYHSAFAAANGQNVVYADIPDPGSVDAGSCLATSVTGFPAPNGGAFADSAINLVAHEGFEGVTDPLFNGWYYQDTAHEVADECEWKFGSVATDGSNIVLNGHDYLVQEMWSDKAGGCFIPPTVPTLGVVASYQVQGGGTGLVPPTFTYYSGGVLQTTVLSNTPETLDVDSGTVWNVTATLTGSTSTERWQTWQASGTLKFGGRFAFTYYRQYFVNFEFGVVGGGSGYSAPSVTITQFGDQASATAASEAGSGVWADSKSSYNYTSQLPGSGSGERWVTQSASGTVGSAGSVSPRYYHQYLVPVSYTGGGVSPSPPVFACSSFGNALDISLGQQPQTVWLDAGAQYSATDPLQGSTATERWFAPSASGTVSSSSALQFVYGQQYQLSVSGGSMVAVTPPSPTGEGFYDAGSSVTVSSALAWNATALTREALASYTLDGGGAQALALPVNASGDFATPVITIDGPHQLVFGSVKQYLVGFRFTNALGSRTIVPTKFEIGTSQPNATFDVQGSRAWLDAGSTFVIKQLLWEGADVGPLGQVSVDAPQNFTVAARVYDASLRVTDYLQIPISGASAHIQLANGTSITRTAGTDGTIYLTSIPLGRFNATVSYLGFSQRVVVDAAQDNQAVVRLPASLPDFSVSAAGIAVVVLLGYAIVRRRRRA